MKLATTTVNVNVKTHTFVFALVFLVLLPLSFSSELGHPNASSSLDTRMSMNMVGAETEVTEAETIAICIPTASVEGCIDTWKQLPFITIFLPTFLQSIKDDTKPFKYKIYLGYDEGDVVYDDETNLVEIKEEIREMLRSFSNVDVQFRRFGVEWSGNIVKIWNTLFDEAYRYRDASGAKIEWFYQANDDVSFNSSGWAEVFTTALRANNYLGVAAPRDFRNKRSMTQTFVHRTHIDCFGEFYPNAFKNWFSDDWITHVYHIFDQRWLQDLVQVHNINPCVRPRYRPDWSGQAIVTRELRAGCVKVGECLERLNRSEHKKYTKHLCDRRGGWWDHQAP